MRRNSAFGMMFCALLLHQANFAASERIAGRGLVPRDLDGSSQGRSEPRQFAQWAYRCVTPYGWCQLYQPLPYGSSCYCPSAYGPVWGTAQ